MSISISVASSEVSTKKDLNHNVRIKPSASASRKTQDNIDPRHRCCYGGAAFCDAIKAMGTRLVFLLHAIIVAWRAATAHSTDVWFLGVMYTTLLIETVIVLAVRRGKEWKWFSPCVLMYLVCTVPGIWVLETASLEEGTVITENNATETVSVGSVQILWTLEQWTWGLSQSMLVLIIVGRWMLPKGDLTRDQLSSLLLCYVGIASDIIDFFTILKEEQTRANLGYFYAVMAVWSWSLLQFAFVRTATADDISDDSDETKYDVESATSTSNTRSKSMDGLKIAATVSIRRMLTSARRNMKLALETEVWSIMLGLLMQDCPFLAVRLVGIAKYDIISDSSLFFVSKNYLVIILQVYRLVSLFREHQEAKRAKREKRKKELLKTMYRNAFLLTKFGGRLGTVRPELTGQKYTDITAS